MGLREQAERDLSFIVEDADNGFGWSITLTDPSGHSAALVGLSNDIAQAIDPGTGMLVSGRVASVALRISTLKEKGFTELPKNIEDSSRKPWVVVFDDIGGESHKFKVCEGNPDRSIGLVTCQLEGYE